jgi:hypothetical protein
MAQIVTDPAGAIFTHPHPPRIWDFFAEYTTQQTNGVVRPPPRSGESLYITDIYIQVNAAVTVTLVEGTAAAGSSNTLFKFIGAAQADGVARSYRVPKKLPPGVALTVTTSGAVTVEVEVHGYTGQ